MSTYFHFLVPESFHKNLVQIGKVVSEIRFEFLYVHDLGPRSRNWGGGGGGGRNLFYGLSLTLRN